MLKSSQARGWLILAGAIAFVVAWESFSSPLLYGQICEKGQHADNENCSTYHIVLVALWHLGKFLNSWEGALTFAATAVIAAFTAILYIATKRIGEISAQQVDDNRINQRAYLWVAPLGIAPFGMAGKAHISVKNVGAIPARDVSWFINHILCGNGKLDSFPTDENQFYGHNFVIHPGAEMSRTHRFRLCHDQAQAFRVSGGKIFFFVYGEVRYLDGFAEKPRCTKFCHRYDSDGLETIPAGKPFAGHSELPAESMRYHQFGNDAD